MGDDISNKEINNDNRKKSNKKSYKEKDSDIIPPPPPPPPPSKKEDVSKNSSVNKKTKRISIFDNETEDLWEQEKKGRKKIRLTDKPCIKEEVSHDFNLKWLKKNNDFLDSIEKEKEKESRDDILTEKNIQVTFHVSSSKEECDEEEVGEPEELQSDLCHINPLYIRYRCFVCNIIMNDKWLFYDNEHYCRSCINIEDILRITDREIEVQMSKQEYILSSIELINNHIEKPLEREIKMNLYSFISYLIVLRKNKY